MKSTVLLILTIIFLTGCTSIDFKDKSKDEQLAEVKLNVLKYCDEKLKASDLSINNYLLAYKREREGVKAAADLSPYDNLAFLDGKTDSVEVALTLPNSYKSYAKNAEGHPVYSTGLHFKLDANGQVISHTGYLLYYGENEAYTALTGSNVNLLYNSFEN